MEKIAISLIPVALFYLIYSRYFLFRPEIIKHVEAFIAGVFTALVMIAAASRIDHSLTFANPVVTALLKAALPEKLAAFGVILLLQRYYPNFSLMEGILSAMVFGIGFSIVENTVYAMNFGISVIIIRILFSLPLHLTTCGIMGYYLAFRKMSSTRLIKTSNTLKGLFIPLMIHWLFDSFLLIKDETSYLAAPLIIASVVGLEFMLAKAQILTPLDILKAMRLRFEDWLSIDRQPKYERWILQSMGIPGSESLPIFAWRPGVIRLLFVILLISSAIAGLAFRPEIIDFLGLSIKANEQIILLGVYPSSIGIILILVGAINPNFLKMGKLKIPVIADADIYIDDTFEESMVTYDITSANCFLRSSEPMGIGREYTFEFQFKKFKSPAVKGTVVWENHQLTGEDNPSGTILKLDAADKAGFSRFLIRYYIFRLTRGIAFNLRLPGFETSRKYFMRPHTTMQSVKIFQPGEDIFSEGDEGSEFYLLKRGRVTFLKKKESGDFITMDTISDGELFGEMAIIGKNSRAATAKCLTECVVAVADIENLNALIFSNPDFAAGLIKKLIGRLHTSEMILVENIKSLERQKVNSEKFYHAAVMLTLIGLGHPTDDKSIKLNVDINKISRVVKNIDDAAIASIINIIMMRARADSDELLDDNISKAIDDLYDKYTIELIE